MLTWQAGWFESAFSFLLLLFDMIRSVVASACWEKGDESRGQSHGGDVVDGGGLRGEHEERAHDQGGQEQNVVVKNAVKEIKGTALE